MKLTQRIVEQIAQSSATYEDFIYAMFAVVEPYRPIREALPGEYVRISLSDHVPHIEGTILRINPLSVTVVVKKRKAYFTDAIVSDDIGILWEMIGITNPKTIGEDIGNLVPFSTKPGEVI